MINVGGLQDIQTCTNIYTLGSWMIFLYFYKIKKYKIEKEKDQKLYISAV